MVGATEKRVAIGCQGGGSLTAFTAGVLSEILQQRGGDEVVAISGSSGGAVCAVLVWDGLVVGDEQRAVENLRGFWHNLSARDPWDRWLNQMAVMHLSLKERGFPTPEISPYDNPFAVWGRRELRRLLEEFVDFDAFADRRGSNELAIYVGAVDITTDQFHVFEGSDVTVDSVLASAAVPPHFPAVEIDGRLYWDGLLSENPPLGVLTDDNPDEIWIVQINDPNQPEEPQSLSKIVDRRNELSANLSLNQEVGFIEKVNTMIANGSIDDESYSHIDIERILLNTPFPSVSKLNRDAVFLDDLFERGITAAELFLAERDG